MDRIYRLTGNFRQNGQWIKPNPSFSGEIVVNSEGMFYGWCRELYNDGPFNTRYLTGYYGPNDYMGEGIAFYKLNNLGLPKPSLFVVEDIYGDIPGHWSIMKEEWTNIESSHYGHGILKRFVFEDVDEATIALERIEYSKEAAALIKQRFEEVSHKVSHNDYLIGNEAYCKLLITNFKGAQE